MESSSGIQASFMQVHQIPICWPYRMSTFVFRFLVLRPDERSRCLLPLRRKSCLWSIQREQTSWTGLLYSRSKRKYFSSPFWRRSNSLRLRLRMVWKLEEEMALVRLQKWLASLGQRYYCFKTSCALTERFRLKAFIRYLESLWAKVISSNRTDRRDVVSWFRQWNRYPFRTWSTPRLIRTSLSARTIRCKESLLIFWSNEYGWDRGRTCWVSVDSIWDSWSMTGFSTSKDLFKVSYMFLLACYFWKLTSWK